MTWVFSISAATAQENAREPIMPPRQAGAPLETGAEAITLGGVCLPEWVDPFGGQPGMNDRVHALIVFDDGSGEALYAGGQFLTAGGVTTRRIAKWDGATWSPLDNNSRPNRFVFALTGFDDGSGRALYAGGQFSEVNGVPAIHVAKWDGASWSSLADGGLYDGVNGPVFALAGFDDGLGSALYVGGRFTGASGKSAGNIAKWDGASWSSVGGVGGVPGSEAVNALIVFDDGSGPALYVGGSFASASGVAANNIAKWDGQSWSPCGAGLSGTVRALAVFDDGSGPALYAGGQFTTAGGVPARHIAKWDGQSWSPLGSGVNGTVRALTAFDNGNGPALYVGGQFGTAGGAPAGRIAKWDGQSWSSLGSGMLGSGAQGVFALSGFLGGASPAVFAGGDFTTSPAGNSYLAKWQGCLLSIPGDLNGDGAVNGSDLSVVLNVFGLTDPSADLNHDGVVNGGDISLILNNWTG